MILGIDEIAGEFDVVGVCIDARTETHGSEPFHLFHGQLDRFLMGVFDARIEQRHDRNRLLGRALKVIEPDRIFDVPGGQFLSGNRIDILLERGENGLGNVLSGEVKIIRKRPAPDAFDDFMFGIIIVAGEVLPIEIGAFSFGRFYPGTGKH